MPEVDKQRRLACPSCNGVVQLESAPSYLCTGCGRRWWAADFVAEAEMKTTGQVLVNVGLADAATGCESIPALLVAIAAPRLRSLGFEVPDTELSNPSERLHAVLEQAAVQGEDEDLPHARYNALLRRIDGVGSHVLNADVRYEQEH
jgi:hypothetical protein